MPTRPPSYPTFEPRTGFTKTPAGGRGPGAGTKVAAAYTPMSPRKVAVRPEGVKIIAILATTHAVLTLLWLVACAVMVLAPGKPADPTIAIAKSDGFLFTWTLGTSLVSFALAMLLLFAATALLSMQSWARRGMMLWAMAWIFLNVAGVVVNVKYLYPLMGKTSAEHATLARAAGLFSGIVLGVAWPIAMIALLQTKKFKHAFTQAASAQAVL